MTIFYIRGVDQYFEKPRKVSQSIVVRDDVSSIMGDTILYNGVMSKTLLNMRPYI